MGQHQFLEPQGAPLQPVKQRHVILDALRGFALLGICLANFPEFSLYSFQPTEVAEAMPTAGIDYVTEWLMLILVDGKFYTIFSILFGIGFSIILTNASQRGISGNRLFLRRMIGLAIIGFLHLMLLWSGDILLLYALMGMLLPLFMRLSDRNMLICAAVLLFLPVVWDTAFYFIGYDPAAAVYDAWWRQADLQGITAENFGTYLRDADSYGQVWAFLVQGAVERMWEFVDSSRYFKVLGLFIIGAYIGRKRLFADIAANADKLRKIAAACIGIGIPMSVVYAMIGTGYVSVDKPVKSLYYFVSVYPMGISYMILLMVAYNRWRQWRLWHILAYPGRMALTNYVTQSVFGILIFYGIGFGVGASLGLAESEAIALCVWIAQVCLSAVWLGAFAYGPLEWLWRMWNYRCYLPLKK